MTIDQALRLWRPTAHYGRLLTEGRNRPAPSIGSPTLIWHLAIWRKRIVGDGGYKETSTKRNVKKYLDHNREFFQEISTFLRRLQDRGLASSGIPRDIALQRIPIPGARNDGRDPFERFEVFLPQSMNFDLWWMDGANAKNPNTRLQEGSSTKEEVEGATRVFVQFQSFQDHVTCTFYMDIAQKFDGNQILDADELANCGARKRRIGEILHIIRKASLGQIKSGAINAPERIAPNNMVIPADLQVDPTELRAAVDYVYREIWEEFQGAFGFELANSGAEGLKSGVVFANLRGALLSHRGLDTPADEARRAHIVKLKELNGISLAENEPLTSQKRPWKPSERAAGDTLGPVDLFDNES